MTAKKKPGAVRAYALVSGGDIQCVRMTKRDLALLIGRGEAVIPVLIVPVAREGKQK